MYRRTDASTDSIVYSLSDLTEFMESRFASFMSRLALDRPGVRPAQGEGDDSPQRRLLQRRGEAHERRVIEALRADGHDLVEIPDDRERALELTLEAMREGRQVICQARLEREPFAGYADFLWRVDDRSSDLGDYAYEVWEAKLAQQTRPYFLIQLCSYAEMLGRVQGHIPARVQVALGEGPRVPYRTDDYRFYFRALERDFLRFMDAFDPDDEPPLPDPRADHRRWQATADARLEALDHVSLTAGVSSGQLRNLAAERIVTMKGLAKSALDHVPRIHDASFERLKLQAQLQVESRGRKRPSYRVLQPAPDDPHKGLALVPPENPLDVWFDMEGYPFGEIEYLFGAAHLVDGQVEYLDWWAHDPREERRALEEFVDWAHARWQRDPDLHIYHYAPYEVSALRRLMGQYGTRENEVDDLLRNHVFVDLYAVVRNGVCVGEPSYSLKNLESLYMEARSGEVTSAADSILQYEAWLESGEPRDWRASHLLEEIRDYNRDDCVSTKLLADWLRERQVEASIAYDPEPATADDERPADEALQARQQLAAVLLEQIPDDPDERAGDAERWRVQQMLAWLLEFHRREAKPFWWTFFARLAMTPQQRVEDPDCLGGLERTDWPAFQILQSTALEYRFDPAQETRLDEGDYCKIPQSPDGGVRLHSLDRSKGRAVISFARRAAPEDRICLMPHQIFPAAPIDASIEAAAIGWTRDGAIRPALEDFLLRRRPRIAGARGGRLVRDGEDAQDAVVRLVHDLDDSTLCIQGPPGSGKTTAAAEAILKLLDSRRTVGITSNSHKAILNLMSSCVEKRPGLACVKIGGGEDDPFFRHPGVEYVASAADADAAPAIARTRLVGGTAWAFSNEALRDRVDWLFVDEAGQVSVANLVGMAPSTRNLVLLGDQMQLGQPIQGHHPGDSGESILEYLLAGHATIPGDLGVFLDQTWRLHPEICSFISGAVYEDRLQPRPRNHERVIRVPTAGVQHVDCEAGLLFVPVEHEGNARASDEEVERIAEIAGELVGRELSYERNGFRGPLRLDDILFVAPYNLQVRRLQERLGKAARVGSVDRFQGQQAPVVIVSMCSSEPSSSARGLRFIFDRNRLNVAISRAFSLAIVVASPALVGGACGSVEDMALSNLFCRIAEQGSR